MTCIVFDPDTVTKMKAILLYTLAQLTILYTVTYKYKASNGKA